MLEKLKEIFDVSENRYELWVQFINQMECNHIAELGVFKGKFAESILKNCPCIARYTMIDPWQNLSNWNSPANKDNPTFEQSFIEAMSRTDFASSKRSVLRGKTIEIIDKIENESLDFIYIDGDHTLRGISIDLINVWDKVKTSGFIAGDDFVPSIWQHDQTYEPTLVFPFAVYFAEAMKAPIYGLPFGQFLMVKNNSGFCFNDHTGGVYKNPHLRNQFIPFNKMYMKKVLKRKFPHLYRWYEKFRFLN